MADLLTTAQVAERLQLDISTINYRVRVGSLPYAQKLPGVTGAYLFDPAVIDALVAETAAAQDIPA